MKVLLVNKFNFIKGGADKYFLDLADLLEANGVTVAKFCMRHPDNRSHKYSRYWPSGINFDHFHWYDIFKYLTHVLWNFEAARKFEALVKDFRPDIIHLHNIYHHLSPSILPVAKKYAIPVVMHLHDYKLVCPNYKMFTRGRIDESCQGGHYWRCVANRCLKDSYAKSFLAALEMWWHHKVLKVYEKNIDLYIAPSKFMKDKMVEWGVADAKIKVLYHFIDVKKFRPDFKPGDYLLYFGRLDREKGVDKLIRALSKVKGNLPLRITGSGPEYKNLKALAIELKLGKRVEFTGPKYGSALEQIIRRAYVVIVPSQWYEVFGLVNLEAAALGKFVIAADIGGIGEAVAARHTALLFKHDNIAELATKINWTLDNPRAVAEGAREAREWVSESFTPKKHWHNLRALYEKVLHQA